MVDTTRTYNHRAIRWKPLINLPHLRLLKLAGSPVLTFNMDSLCHSPRLESLLLGMLTTTHGHYIPPPVDMENEDLASQGQREDEALGSSQGCNSIGETPRFTWDWYLPNLRKLDLRAVFAFKFDFQWIQHLPNLQSISLNTTSTRRGLHERSITLKEISRPQQEQDDEDRVQNISDRYLSSPKLNSIILEGHWIFDTNVLEVLLLTVAPDLREISFGADCVGFTFRERVTLVRRMPRVKRSNLGRQVGADEIQELGLVPDCELRDRQRNKRLRKHIISLEQFWDVLDP